MENTELTIKKGTMSDAELAREQLTRIHGAKVSYLESAKNTNLGDPIGDDRIIAFIATMKEQKAFWAKIEAQAIEKGKTGVLK